MGENLDHVKIIIEKRHEIAQNTGLKILYTKTEYFVLNNMTTKLKKHINSVTKFKSRRNFQQN